MVDGWVCFLAGVVVGVLGVLLVWAVWRANQG